jgi:mannose-6-phosphate isomerase-like protein (cupin superfamily)
MTSASLTADRYHPAAPTVSTLVTSGTHRCTRNGQRHAASAGYARAVQIIEGAGAWSPPAGSDNDWVEHLRVPDLSVGTYCIPVGGLDNQSPHTEDEIYVVTTGRARITTPEGAADVGPGAVIFVPAGEEHRFEDVTEDLALLVVFGPAYGSRSQ